MITPSTVVGSLVPTATPTPDCTGHDLLLQKPTPGSQCRVGERITIGWNGGHVTDNPSWRSAAVWNGYLVRGEDPQSRSTAMFGVKTFISGNPNWDIEDPCGGSQMEYEWTIPTDFLPDNSSAIYRYLLVRETGRLFAGVAPTFDVFSPTTRSMLPLTTEGQVRWDQAELYAREEREKKGQQQQQQTFEADGSQLSELTAEPAQKRYCRVQEELVELPSHDVL